MKGIRQKSMRKICALKKGVGIPTPCFYDFHWHPVSLWLLLSHRCRGGGQADGPSVLGGSPFASPNVFSSDQALSAELPNSLRAHFVQLPFS